MNARTRTGRDGNAGLGGLNASGQSAVDTFERQGQGTIGTRARIIILSTIDTLDTIGRVSDITISLDLATAHTIDTDFRFDHVDKVSKTSTGGANGGLDVVL